MVTVKQPRVLFVGHDASRTGAPAVGLAFLRWLVEGGRAKVSIRLLNGGPRVDDHRALAPTVLAHHHLATGADAVEAALGGAGLPGGWMAAAVARRVRSPRSGAGGTSPSIVVANTLASLAPAVHLARHAPLVCWVHELDGVADRVIPVEQRRELIDQVDHFVAAGRRVEAMLVVRWGIATERITCVDDFIDDVPVCAPNAVDPPVHVLGAGSPVPRKGVDSFLAVVAILVRGRADLRAAWVGGRQENTSYRAEIARDLLTPELAGHVALVPETAELESWWPADGVLLHTAREDPSPLVAVEAGVRTIPVVTWDTGGAADLLVRSGLANLVAPPGDLLGMARRVEALLADPCERHRAGAALQAEAITRTARHQAPAVWAALQATLR